MKRNVVLAAGLLAAGALQGHAQDQVEPVARFDSLSHDLAPEAAAAWEKSPPFGKTLAQGVKFDSQGNIYVSTARWGGADTSATLSRLVGEGENRSLQPFPSAGMNAMDNPEGLKAVLGFEIDEDDVMWILDQGHVAGAPSEPGAEKLVLWDLKGGEIQRIEFGDDVTNKTCSFLNDVAVDNEASFVFNIGGRKVLENGPMRTGATASPCRATAPRCIGPT